MPTIWEYVLSGSVERDVQKNSSFTTGDASESFTITANHLTLGEVQTQVGYCKASSVSEKSYTMLNGDTASGAVKNVSYQQGDKTGLYSMTITLQKLISGTPLWGWILSGSVSRNDVNNLTTDATSNPDESYTVTAKGAPYSEVTAQIAAAKSGVASATYSILGGGSISGTIKSVNFSQQDGSTRYDITVTLQKIVTEAVIWGYYGSGSVSRNLVTAKSINAAAPKRRYSCEEADEKFTLVAEKAPMSEVAIQKALVKAISTAETTYVCQDGMEYSGIPVALSYNPVKGTGLYDITVTIEV